MWLVLWDEAEKRPLILCAFFFIVGTALGKKFWEINPLLLFSFAFLALFTALLFFSFRPSSSRLLFSVLLFFLFAAIMNFYRCVNVSQSEISNFTGSNLSITGIVWDQPVVNGTRTSFDLKVQEVEGPAGILKAEGAGLENVTGEAVSQNVSGKVRVTLYGSGELNYGDRVRVRGELELPPGRRNPGGFDYRFYLLTRGVSSTLRTEFRQVQWLEGGGGNPLVFYSLSLRRNLLRKIEEALPPKEAALFGGILLGDRDGIPQAMQQNFQRAGLAHLLAVSGLHVGLAAGFLLTLFKYFKMKEAASWAFTLIIILVYLGVIGFKASALRASLLLFIGAGAFLLKREKDPLTALSAAALAILLFKPLWLFTLSFQLSFTAALSIFLLTPIFEKHTDFIPKFLRGILCVTLAAQLGVFPLTAYYFYEVSLISLLANVLALPVVGMVVSMGFLSIICSFLFPGVEVYLFRICGLLLSYLLNTAGFLSQLPGAFLKINPPGLLSFLTYYFSLFLLLPQGGLWEKARQIKAVNIKEFIFSRTRIIPLALSLSLLLIWLPVISGQPELTVVFLDVGQGDSAFIQTSSGRHILIDAGGSPAYLQTEEYGRDFVGERVVVPFLRHQGVKKLDMVILSHPHEDHYGGLLAVLENFPVGLFVTTRARSDFPLFDELMTMVEEKNIPLVYMEAEERISSPEFTLEFFCPPQNLFMGTPADLNNNSLVFRMTAGSGEAAFLFTGDAEQAAEEFMLRSGFPLQSHVLKVGHHGGRSSTGEGFLEAVNPEIAVIPVGRNSFGHPSEQVLERLEDQGVVIYRNDWHGAVTVKVKGDRIWVKPFIRRVN